MEGSNLRNKGNPNMVRMSISLSKEIEKKLRNVSKEEHRKYSDQIEHMLEFYLKHRGTVK